MEKKFKYKKKVNKNILFGFLFFMFLLFVVYAIGTFTNKKSNEVFGDDKIDMFFFHLRTCPHCLKQKEFHKILKEKYPQLNIIEYEVNEEKTKEIIINFSKNFSQIDPNKFSTPTTVIGNEVIIGFGSQATTGKKLEESIKLEIQRVEKNLNENSTRTINLRKQ